MKVDYPYMKTIVEFNSGIITTAAVIHILNLILLFIDKAQYTQNIKI
ncbi:hypothetical protein SAMN06295967_10667 [Belliella buryatensis]|uniref:Uncharacterized protein n=1 Tax=Belliella buryatensis TaxID=1500549 RepID=A0A239D107_9BACT|nr:hypothetical protein SAMN06295967_10667 [Belliella buryatensis]